jgi:membrane protein
MRATGSAGSTSAAVQAARSRVARLRERYEWLDHLARAATRYFEQRGNHFAAAITFFTVLSVVPLLMIAFAAVGYALTFSPALLAELKSSIAASVPPAVAETIEPIVEVAIAQRNTVAGFGLLAALYAGIWWMSNLREAVSAQWGLPALSPAALQRLLYDLVALVGLGTALIGSFALTVLTTGVVEAGLALVGLADYEWTRVLLAVVGVLASLAADWAIFVWAIARLPRAPVPLRSVVKAALLGAIGFEVLKQGMTVYLNAVSGSPGGAVFGSLLGLMLFAYVVARFVLFVTAWAATAAGNRGPTEVRPAAWPPLAVEVREGPTPATAATAAGVALAAGVLLGLWLSGARVVRPWGRCRPPRVKPPRRSRAEDPLPALPTTSRS